MHKLLPGNGGGFPVHRVGVDHSSPWGQFVGLRHPYLGWQGMYRFLFLLVGLDDGNLRP